jgi:hypothetical protein
VARDNEGRGCYAIDLQVYPCGRLQPPVLAVDNEAASGAMALMTRDFSWSPVHVSHAIYLAVLSRSRKYQSHQSCSYPRS